MKRFLLFLALLLAVLACAVPGGGVPATTPPPPTISPLTPQMLRNGTYYAPFYQRMVTLTNGSYSENTLAGSYSVQMLDTYALTDLNGDNVEDGVILLAENGGGSGVFESLVVVLNQGGGPHQVGQAQLGDRVQINSVAISYGKVVLDMFVQGPDDPLCCPNQPVVQIYRLVEGALWMTRQTSRTPIGTERAINITSPADGATVTNPFAVTGGVTIAPFENNLAYRIYFPGGEKIAESALGVTSGGMGEPGSFNLPIDLSTAGATGTIIVQLLDLSAADGSTLALDSVVLVIH